MADNITLNLGSEDGATVATEDIASVHYQKIKLTASGTATTEDLSKAEDSAHSTGEHGIMGLAVRNDTPANLSGADNDYEPLQVSAGRLWASAVITDLIPGVGATNLGKAEDAAHSSGDIGVMDLAVRNDVLASLVGADGDYAPHQVDGLGALWTHHTPNLIDTGNSSTDVLAGAAAFTGTGKDVLDFHTISITIDSSHDSATDGMTFQFSTDNSNWDDINTFTYTAADGARRFNFPVTAQYFRVVYTNGGTLQTHFRLQTILHYGASAPSVHRLVDDVDPDRSASLVKAALIAQISGTGDFTPVAANAAGKLQVAAEISNDDQLSTNNSTTSTLNSGIAFTGTGDDCLGFTSVTVQLDASHDSAADGMTFQFSIDDSNWDDVYPFTYTAADGARRFQFPITGRYFRVVYTNGGTNQTHFRVQTILHRQPVITTIHRAGDDIDPDRSATLVKSILIAQISGTGDFTPIDATAGGNLKSAVEEFDAAVDFTKAEDAAHSTGDIGAYMLAVRDDALAAHSGTDGDYESLHTTALGALWAALAATNAGGCKMFTSVDLDESEEDVATGPVTIYGLFPWNLTDAPLWLQLFNTNTVTVGTTAPDNNFVIPANADSDGSGVVLQIPSCGVEYDTALTVAITTGSGTDSGAPGAGDAGIVVLYKD